MVDYTAPPGEVCADHEKNSVSFDYVGQVHHYRMLAIAAGVPIDELAIMCLDPRGFLITPTRWTTTQTLRKAAPWRRATSGTTS